jgi:hypothetical protein
MEFPPPPRDEGEEKNLQEKGTPDQAFGLVGLQGLDRSCPECVVIGDLPVLASRKRGWG